MATIELFYRWQTIREIICANKSGALILQIGRNYLHWNIQRGQLLCVSSTLPEHSFTQYILAAEGHCNERFLKAQSDVSDTHSFGATLLQAGVLEPAELRSLLQEHCMSLSHFLIESGNHLLWSDRCAAMKPSFARLDLPLSRLILSLERTSVPVRSAVEFAELRLEEYRIEAWNAVEPLLQEKERKLMPYLKRCDPLSVILGDSVLDRMTCYRALFLLWLSGHLQPPIRPTADSSSRKTSALTDRVKAVPPDWIFPLILGLLIGVVFSPDPPKEPDPPRSIPAWTAPPRYHSGWQDAEIDDEETESTESERNTD